MRIKTRSSTANRNIKLRVTKKMPPQTFHLDHKSEGINLLTTLPIIMEFMSHTLHKLALAKQATCKITCQISEAPKAQIMTFMSQLGTDLVTENKWRVLELVELLVLPLQGTKESETLSGWLES